MPPPSRQARVGDQIRVELSELLARGVRDPGIGFLTITHVKVAPDLQQARVFYTTIGDDKSRAETRKALDRATPFLRRQIGQRLQLRRVPELVFTFDESIEKQDRIERILQDINAERADAPDAGDRDPQDPGDDAE
jgi:ribosome-binding factor A